MQLQHDLPILRRAGLGLAAISYDSSAVLAEFAKRKAITFPLLSDHESKVIQKYGVADRKYRKGMELDVETEMLYFNSAGRVPVFGLSYPAVFVLGRDHRVKWRFVSEGPELRLTGAAILEEAIGGVADESRTVVSSRSIQVTATATNTSVGLGNRIRIAVELKIPAGFHVYSPEVGSGYKGVSWRMDPTECFEFGDPVYPKPEWRLMKATGERLPVYERTLRVSREILVKPAIRANDPSLFKLFCKLCLDSASQMKASATFAFQACNDDRCYPPETVRPQWKFHFFAPDRQRSPDDLKREFEEWQSKEPRQ